MKRVSKESKKIGTAWVIFWLILFFPIGAYLAWAKTNWSKRTKLAVICIWGILLFVYLSSKVHSASTISNVPEEVVQPTGDISRREMDAKVGLNAVAFQITNNEDSSWKHCKLEINASRLLSSGWVYNLDEIPAKSLITVSYSEFTNDDGTRFDAYTTKPKSLSISCNNVGDGKTGFNYFATQ